MYVLYYSLWKNFKYCYVEKCEYLILDLFLICISVCYLYQVIADVLTSYMISLFTLFISTGNCIKFFKELVRKIGYSVPRSDLMGDQFQQEGLRINSNRRVRESVPRIDYWELEIPVFCLHDLQWRVVRKLWELYSVPRTNSRNSVFGSWNRFLGPVLFNNFSQFLTTLLVIFISKLNRRQN